MISLAVTTPYIHTVLKIIISWCEILVSELVSVLVRCTVDVMLTTRGSKGFMREWPMAITGYLTHYSISISYG